jgi:hypothetical protein
VLLGLSSEALEKMKDVYEKNPQMGDPASLSPQINQTAQNMERLRGELNKYEVMDSPLLATVMYCMHCSHMQARIHIVCYLFT